MNTRKRPTRDALPLPLLEEMAECLKIMAHPQRLRLLEALESATRAPVHDLTEKLGIPQAAVSHHLNTMRRCRLVECERDGKEVWYKIANPNCVTILNCIRKKASQS